MMRFLCFIMSQNHIHSAALTDGHLQAAGSTHLIDDFMNVEMFDSIAVV